MEKYRRFADAGTGIQPFVPVVPRPPQGAARYLQPLKRLAVGPLLAVPRLLLAAVALLLLAVLGVALPALFAWLPPLHRALGRAGCFVSARLALFAFGFHRIRDLPWPVHYLGPHAFAYTPYHPQAGPGGAAPPPTRPHPVSARADLIVANLQSCFDVLYLAHRYGPAVFCFPATEGKVLPYGVLGALWATSFGLDAPERRGTDPSLTAAKPLGVVLVEARRRRQPVVVFAEGTTTNGRGVLKFVRQTFDTLGARRDIGLALVAFRYEARYWHPSLPVGAAGPFLWRALCQLSNTVHVRHVRSAEVDAMAETGALDAPGAGNVPAWSDRVRTKIAHAAMVEPVSCTREQKWEFLEQWREAHSGGYTRAAAAAATKRA